MVDISKLRESTLDAATKAKDAGIISQAQFDRITDGTVSEPDVALARQLLRDHAATDALGNAEELSTAIMRELAAKRSPMPDIGKLRESTLNAATKAKDAGIISQAQFDRITGRTISVSDISLGRQLVRDHSSTDLVDIAQELSTAVANQYAAQRSATTILESP